MTADNEIDIKEAFQRAQKGHNNKAKLVASLKSRYSKVRSKRKAIIFSFAFSFIDELFKYARYVVT